MKGDFVAKKSNGSGILEKLGIYGMSEIEDLILAGLVTGDPVLLVGTHGAAKTLLCSRLARAMGLKFWAYDASKALFEDVIGFPNPYEIKDGRIGYVSTPLSIWDKEFVLIDEISRANYQMQAKWLELIRSRTVMGQRADSVQYIFSAMNPPNYPGARPLDPALAGRFGFIIEVPVFSSMSEEDQKRIIRALSEDDSIHLFHQDFWESVEINMIITDARKKFPEIEEKLNSKIENYILFLKDALNDGGFFLDGRRAGMIRRGLIAILSIKNLKGDNIENSLTSIFRFATPYLLPYSVEMERFNPDSLNEIIEDAISGLSGEKIYSFGMIQNELKLTRMLKKLQEEIEIDRQIDILLNLDKLVENASEDFILRVYNVYDEFFSVNNMCCDAFLNHIVIKEKINNNGICTLSRGESLAYWFYFALFDKERRRRIEIADTTLSEIKEKLTKKIGGKK